MKESAIVSKIVKAVKAKYPKIYIRKLADRHTRGLPDLVIVVHCNDEKFKRPTHDVQEWGGILFVEAKTMYGRVGPLQVLEANAIYENGGEAIFARNPEEVLNKLEEMGAIP